MLPIFIQTYEREFHSGQLLNFFKNNSPALSQASCIQIFTDVPSKHQLPLQPELKSVLNDFSVNIHYIDTKTSTNHTSYIWAVMVKHGVKDYPSILVLEADTHLKANALEVLKPYAGLEDDFAWIYSSHYRGINSWFNGRNAWKRYHVNGVGVYNRTPEYLRLVTYATDRTHMLCDSLNYDWFMHRYIHSRQPEHIAHKKFLDSEHILNISPPEDIDLDYTEYKPDCVVLHKKGTVDPSYYTSSL